MRKKGEPMEKAGPDTEEKSRSTSEEDTSGDRCGLIAATQRYQGKGWSRSPSAAINRVLQDRRTRTNSLTSRDKNCWDTMDLRCTDFLKAVHRGCTHRCRWCKKTHFRRLRRGRGRSRSWRLNSRHMCQQDSWLSTERCRETDLRRR